MRLNCYFGKSNWNSDALFNGCMDDIKLFERGLTQAEVMAEMNAMRPMEPVAPVDPAELPAGKVEKKGTLI